MAHLVAPPSPSWRHHAKVGTAAFVLRVFSKISLKISPETSVKWDSIRPTELTIKIKRLEKPIKIFDFFFPQFWRRPPHIFRSGHDLISQQGVVPKIIGGHRQYHHQDDHRPPSTFAKHLKMASMMEKVPSKLVINPLLLRKN